MSDMKAINEEALRRFDDTDTGESMSWEENAFRLADIRDQLIKEGWTPRPDVAAELYDAVMLHDRDYSITLIRGALFKARAHPADVVEAAEDVHRRYAKETSPRLMAEYILKDVWREPTE